MTDPEKAGATTEGQRVPIIEEQVAIGKRSIETGRVRVHRRVVEHQERLAETLASEHVTVERVAIGRDIDAVPPTREEGDVTIVPVVEEQLVVTRQLVLREEIRLTRTRSEERVEVPVTLKRTEVEIERE